MNIPGFVQKVLIYMLLIWSIGCSLCFFLGFASEDISSELSPDLPLPWSDVDDFTKLPDGDIYVALRFFRRIVRYDQMGNFISSYPYPSRHSSDLTEARIVSDDILYIQLDNTLYASTPEIQTISAVKPPQKASSPENIRSETRERLAFLPTLQGAMLFEDDYKWMQYVVPPSEPHQEDKTLLLRNWYGLEIRSSDGVVFSRIGTPWYFIPFLFPWPALLAWPLTLVAIVISNVDSVHICYRNARDEKEQQYSKLTAIERKEPKRRFLISSDLQEKTLPKKLQKKGRKQEIFIHETSQGNRQISIPKKEYRRKGEVLAACIVTPILLTLFGGLSVLAPFKAFQERYADDMLLWILLIFGFAGYAWITLGWVSFRLFYDVAGSENIHLDSRENRVSFFKKIHFRLFPGVPLFFEMNFRKQSSSINNAQVNMKVAPSFVDGQIQRKLRLTLNGKKITLVPERSGETKQQLLAYLQNTLELIQTYAAIKTVAFGGASSEQAGFLRNPDVSELTVGMPELKKLEIYADSYNLHQVEQFLTYAVNYIGPERLQKQVDVVLYGKPEQLHPNLHNTLQHLFKQFCIVNEGIYE